MAEPRILSAARLAGARESLGKATTLPADAFTSPEVYARECERLFAQEWLCAGRVDQIPEPGDYFTLDLLDEKLVVVRGSDGVIRVLSRVCRHRAALVVEGSGNARSFQCPYHAWTYRLDGRLVGAPLMEEASGFDRASCRLPEIASELWEGWIFVNLSGDAEPLGPRLAPLSQRLASYRMEELVAIPTATFDSPFNWKVLVDNFMEAYHHLAIHRDTLEPLFPAARSFTPDAEGPFSMLCMPAADSDDAAGDPTQGLPRVGPTTPEEEHQLVAAVVFPFHLFAPSARFLSWYQLLPCGVDRFTLRIYSCFPRQALDDPGLREAIEGAQAVTRLIHEQDIAACEAVFRGLRSPGFEAGPLAPLERSLWQFNQWWIERMAGESGAG